MAIGPDHNNRCPVISVVLPGGVSLEKMIFTAVLPEYALRLTNIMSPQKLVLLRPHGR